MPMIEIWNAPCISLGDLLDRVSTTSDLNWSILELWAVSRDEAMNVVALEQQVATSPTGLELTISQLRALSDGLTQIIDGIFVGYRGDPPVRSLADLRSAAEVVIEPIDSTFWRIYARDGADLDRLRQDFSNVLDVVPETPLPPIHRAS